MGIVKDVVTAVSEKTGKKNTAYSQAGMSGEAQHGYNLDDTDNTDRDLSPYIIGYGGGSGSGKSAEEIQKETQQQLNNTVGNYNKRGWDMSKQGIDSLKNIQAQIDQNTKLRDQNSRNIMRSIEWQPQEQRKQSTRSALRDRMGNAANGSGLVDLMEGMARYDDMSDVALISSWKQSENENYENWFQTAQDLVSDYIDQVNQIKDEFSKLYAQYWSTISNIDPYTAAAKNISASAAGEKSSTDDYTLAGASGLTASKDLQKMYKVPKRGSAVNPRTRDFVRPDRDVTTINRKWNGSTGTPHPWTIANRGFKDNLNVYQRRV